jgi:hypothetical protein
MTFARRVNWHPLTPLALFSLVYWKATIAQFPWHSYVVLGILVLWFVLILANWATKGKVAAKIHRDKE